LVYYTSFMDYETVIGLEVHAQLLTKSKMFCSCSTDYVDAPPNTHVCPICLGMPGTLPVINKKAVEYTIVTALALNCAISEYSKFDRKNYFYPDMMKNYQISQYDAPIGRQGWLVINSDGHQKKVNITRVHLEEDVAKLWHRANYSLVDVNRSGIPLMETVSEPEISSAEEARDYLIKLHTILRYLGVSTGNMEDGSFRCDANISIRPSGSKELLSKVEVKNMNSFKAVYQALKYESERQREVLDKGGKLVQETRGWLDEKGITVSQRSKEYADDYRYFPEPDLPPLFLDMAWIEEIKAKLPELPEARKERVMAQYGLPLYDANILTGSKAIADYFENCLKLTDPNKAKMVSNWLLGDFSRLLNATNSDIENTRISPSMLVELLNLVVTPSTLPLTLTSYAPTITISGPTAKAVFEEMFYTGKKASDIVAEKKLGQISNVTELRTIVEQVLANNAKAVADYSHGKQQALTFLTGQVMKATRGTANPSVVTEILMQQLGGG